MTNEEAFEKWAIDYGLDYEPSFTRYDVEAAWQAAIAYMQEQSEPVGELILGPAFLPALKSPLVNWKINLVDLEVSTKFYTSPQRQQPLKRLSNTDLDRLWNIATYDAIAHEEPYTRYRFYELIVKELNND